MRAAWTVLLVALPIAGLVAGDAPSRYAGLPGGRFESTLDYEDIEGSVEVAPFALMRKPVTNADFLAFVRTLKLHQIEGASGFQHFKADLEDRAAIRSGGHVKQVLIRTLLFE